ncbi:MAG: RNA-binding protein [Bacteroidota bacterium]
MNIFVAKLDFSTDTSTLESAFAEYGEVSSVKIIMDKETGRSKGYGFVEMPNDDEALTAISRLDQTELHGRTILVKKSEPRNNDRGGRRDFGRGRSGGHNRGRSGGGYRDRDRDRDGGGYNRRY